MTAVKNLEPKKVFGFFDEISKIPRGSGNTKAVSDYCVAFANARGLKVIQDEVNNIIIYKDGTSGYENSEPVILQGHLDMVCEKTQESSHDFEKDPLQLYVEDGYVKAKDTTLGADNGIAVSYALAILDSDDIPHPPLEVVFTIDEETGMDGAIALDMSLFKGKCFLNLDSEDEGVITVGCAGGMSYEMTQPVTREEAEGEVLQISICGLCGGHSGVEIHKQLGNANKMAGRFLTHLQNVCDYRLISVNGGSKGNVITSVCDIELLAASADVEKVAQAVSEYETIWRAEFSKDEPNLKVIFTKCGAAKKSVLTKEDALKAAFYLNICPNGVYEYNRFLEGLVETSNNLGVTETKEDCIVYQMLVRSAVASKTEEVKERLEQLTSMLGCTSKISGQFPAWAYREESRLRDVAVECYEELYGVKPTVETIHAGLECGILSDKKPDLDCISMGPRMHDIHSFNERLDIDSTKRTWEYILAILKALK